MSLKGFKQCTCLECGWVHMGVTRKYAEEEVRSFNIYFHKLTKKKQKEFYGGKKATIRAYEQCWCGSKEFRAAKKGDCPVGCTIGPVIWEP